MAKTACNSSCDCCYETVSDTVHLARQMWHVTRGLLMIFGAIALFAFVSACAATPHRLLTASDPQWQRECLSGSPHIVPEGCAYPNPH